MHSPAESDETSGPRVVAAHHVDPGPVLAAGWFGPAGELRDVAAAAGLFGEHSRSRPGVRAVVAHENRVPARTLLAVTPQELWALAGDWDLNVTGLFRRWRRSDLAVTAHTAGLVFTLTVHNVRTGNVFRFETTRHHLDGRGDVVVRLLQSEDDALER